MALSDHDGKESIIDRSNAGFGAGLRTSDKWRAWCISKGGGGHDTHDIEKAMFAAHSGVGKTYTELQGSFLAAQGYSGLSLKDNWKRWLSGGTL